MQLKEFGVSLKDLIQEFNFEVVYGPDGFEKTEITRDDAVQDCSLQAFLTFLTLTVCR